MVKALVVWCNVCVAGKHMWDSGVCEDWFKDSHPEVHKVAKTVNGQMLEDLAAAIGHTDKAVVELFRQGAPLYGMLKYSGIG